MEFGEKSAQALLVQVVEQGSMGSLTATYAGLIMLIAPISATVSAWIFFNEAMDLYQITGMVIVIRSIAAAIIGGQKLAICSFFFKKYCNLSHISLCGLYALSNSSSKRRKDPKGTNPDKDRF